MQPTRRTVALTIGQLMALILAAVVIFVAAVDLPDGGSAPPARPSTGRTAAHQHDLAAHHR
jgi:hypothetical protein